MPFISGSVCAGKPGGSRGLKMHCICHASMAELSGKMGEVVYWKACSAKLQRKLSFRGVAAMQASFTPPLALVIEKTYAICRS